MHKRLSLWGMGLLLVLVMAACASPQPAQAPAAPAPKAQATTAPAQPTAAPAQPTAAPAQPTAAPAVKATEAPKAAAPASGATGAKPDFVFAHTGPIYTMDAPVTWFGSTHWLTNALYDCLIWRKADGTGYVGQSAEKWERVNDTTWRFTLRPNLKFQNGEPLDAEAVKWNIDRTRTTKEFMVQPQWQFVQEVKVVDPRTVDVITAKPWAYTEYDISYNGCELLPPKYYQQVGAEGFAKKPVGSGPYKLAEFTEGQKYVFEAWDGYWAGKPEVERVIYQIIPERSSQIAALLAGQVSFVPGVPIPDRKRLETTSGIKILRETSGRMHHLYLRSETESGKMKETYPGYQPVTLDKRVRQAISYALDRKLLAEIQGSGVPTLVRVPRSQPESFGDKYSGKVAEAWYNPTKAKQLLAEAGYGPNKKPKVYFDAPAVQDGNEKEVAEAIKTLLEDVGFEVELKVLDLAAYNSQVGTPGNNRDIQMVTLGGAPSLTPTFYTCEWKQANYSVCVQEWSDLGKQIISTVDPQARLALWDKWWTYYLDYAQTVTLYEINAVMAMSDKFEWTPRTDGWFTFRDLKYKK